MRSSKSKLNYGKVEVEPGSFDPENTKIRISAMVDADVVLALKERAGKEKTKYQTLMNALLRQALFGGEPAQIDQIEIALLKRGFIKRSN